MEFLIFWGISAVVCMLGMLGGVLVQKWEGEGTTAKDFIIGFFVAMIPFINIFVAIFCWGYFIGGVLKKAEKIEVIHGD